MMTRWTSLRNTVSINVISSKRPNNVTNFPIEDATWFVGDNEYEQYKSNGAKQVIESGSLIESRNQALQHSFDKGQDCVMLDDDFVRIQNYQHNTLTTISLQQAIEQAQLILYEALRARFYLAGFAPTTNTFYYNMNKPITFNTFIISAFIYVRHGCNLYFDTNLRTKEDYDYTLQHIDKYGGAARINYILPEFKHFGNKGGVVDYRTPQVEQNSIAYLKRKWGNDIIRDNPRRANEILLRIPV